MASLKAKEHFTGLLENNIESIKGIIVEGGKQFLFSVCAFSPEKEIVVLKVKPKKFIEIDLNKIIGIIRGPL